MIKEYDTFFEESGKFAHGLHPVGFIIAGVLVGVGTNLCY